MAIDRRRLPDFPWDLIAEQMARARRHPDGVVDLSMGTPVDPVPEVVSSALSVGADESGYPATYGTEELRAAAVGRLERQHGLVGLDPAAVLPSIGSKELIAWLPTLLGAGPGDVVALPELAYPTYEVGARLAGAEVVRLRDGEPPPKGTVLCWLNSPSNPTGRVLPPDLLADTVRAARAVDAVVASDECYLALGWDTEPVSVLAPEICGDDLTGVLAVHSLSKSSNLAGYRAGFVAGDLDLVRRLLHVRKHAGMIVPRPVQRAMTAALHDDQHVLDQRERYRKRREVLREACEAAGFRVDHSEAGLYLWITRDEDAWVSLGWFANRGIAVAPGTFYGPSGERHVRVALTASDDDVAAASGRLVRGALSA
jgi:succinyldiaminopimelate transaminase